MEDNINQENLRYEQYNRHYNIQCDTIEFISKYIKDYESKILWVIISTLTVIGGLLLYIINNIFTYFQTQQIVHSNVNIASPKFIMFSLMSVVILLLCLGGYKIVLLYLNHCRASMKNHLTEIDSCVMKSIAEFAGSFLRIRIESMKKSYENIESSFKMWNKIIKVGMTLLFVLTVLIFISNFFIH